MKQKSITHKQRASSRKRECPRADVPTRGNSPDWYTRENLPYRGENFNALSSLTPQPGVMFEGGVSTSAAVVHRTVIHPPVDPQQSFWKKAADFYAEIRERNSGAANYNVEYLAAYMYNVGVLHALAHVCTRALKGIRSVMPGSADSPYIISALVGCPNYDDVASRLAVLANRYSVLAKDIENLPLPHIAAFDRSRFLYSSLFSDSSNPKPSLVAFIPRFVIEIDPTGNTLAFTQHNITSKTGVNESIIDLSLNLMSEMLQRITSNTVYTIIRGDIRNAYGNSAYWDGLVNLLNTHLNVLPEDREVMSQLENLSLLPVDASLVPLPLYEYSETDKQHVLRVVIDGVNDSNGISRVWCDNNLVNYHGSYPSDGELLAITRMMPVGYKENNVTNTRVVITASSGNTVVQSLLILSVARDTWQTAELADLMLKAQSSTVQSTMKSAMELLAFTASNIAHFPMIIFSDDPRGYMWDTDNYAILSNVNVINMTIIANRSLWDVHLPRGEAGRLEKKA